MRYFGARITRSRQKRMRLGLGVIERENAFAKARHDASAIDAETRRLLDQAEFDRGTSKAAPVSSATRTKRGGHPAIGLHIIGEHRIGEHRHMAKDIVEHVRFLEIIELVSAADEIPRSPAIRN